MSNAPSRSSDGDVLTMLAVGMLLLGSAGTGVALAWSKILTWSLEQQVLLPAAADPMVVIPGSDGAGLDVPRIAVAAAVLLVVLAVAGGVATRAVRGRDELR